MFSDGQAKNLLVKSDELFCQWRNFLATISFTDFFSSNKVIQMDRSYNESYITFSKNI